MYVSFMTPKYRDRLFEYFDRIQNCLECHIYLTSHTKTIPNIKFQEIENQRQINTDVTLIKW